jgi:hypothetical protein
MVFQRIYRSLVELFSSDSRQRKEAFHANINISLSLDVNLEEEVNLSYSIVVKELSPFYYLERIHAF